MFIVVFKINGGIFNSIQKRILRGGYMIPIKYFWSEIPTDQEIYDAKSIAENEDCVVIVKWNVFGCTYSMIVRKGMPFE